MKPLVQLLEKAQGFLGVILFVALILVVFSQVITRYVLHTPLLWSEEAARFLLFWVALLGAGMSVKTKKHFTIEVMDFEKLRNPSLRTTLRLIPDVCIFLFGIFMTIVGTSYSVMGGLRVATNSRINMRYVFAAIPIAGITIVVYSAYHIFVTLKKHKQSGPS
jgi:TRAP-type C4-dicarboxylate transport system permease small subunit